MTTRDPRVDAYIAAAAPFARPLLARLREDLHAASPDLDETIKWGRPVVTYRGRLVAGFAAFKQHASFGFWSADAVPGGRESDGMGQFGKLSSLADLPTREVIADGVRRSIARLEAPAAPSAKPRTPRAPLPVPDAFQRALDAHPAARAAFEAFAPSHRREYVEWVTEAKREDTRARRIAQSVEWLAEGKPRHWKHGAR